MEQEQTQAIQETVAENVAPAEAETVIEQAEAIRQEALLNAVDFMTESQLQAYKEAQSKALEQIIKKAQQVAEVCTAVGLKVEISGSWVKITDGDDVTTKDMCKLLGKDGLGLRYRRYKNSQKGYWLFNQSLPEGYYWSQKDKIIKVKGE